MRSNSLFLALTLAIFCTACSRAVNSQQLKLREGPIPATRSHIELKKNNEGSWRLWVNKREFAIRGAGGARSPGMLEQLKIAGGNSVRTWGMEGLETKVSDGERFIDRAWRAGIMVVPGFWVQHERHGFDYSNLKKVKKQRASLRAGIRKYKNHPAVLVWGLGNEMEGPSSAGGSIAVFKELEILARIIKSEDPHHPVMTVIAGANPEKIKNLMKYCPSIDILGINYYAGVGVAGQRILDAGWSKPFAVTEFGVAGQWEVAKTSWGAELEQTSHEKARAYYAGHKLVFDTNAGHELCLGTYAFLWGWKQECTATWFGMYLPTLEKLPQVDAMTKAWTGKWPENRCPKIKRLSSEAYSKIVKPGKKLKAEVDVEDPNGDSMTYKWLVVSESTDRKGGGDKEAVPPSHPQLIKKNNSKNVVFKSPSKPGNYRLFLSVHDNKGGAATANFPFRVE